MKIIYASVHHKNTDIGGENLIVFASGIYFNTFHKAILDYIRRTDLDSKTCILLYTCGLRYRDYAGQTGELLAERGAAYIGSCYCRGFDTYGPLEKIGGIAKKHPTESDLVRVAKRMEQLVSDKT